MKKHILLALMVFGLSFSSAVAEPHSSDYNPQDWRISLSELLRAIQFFNVGSLHCDATTEDGFAPGPGSTNCSPHSSDYNPQDWRISLSELLRAVQFFNVGGYCPSTSSEDGFAPLSSSCIDGEGEGSVEGETEGGVEGEGEGSLEGAAEGEAEGEGEGEGEGAAEGEGALEGEGSSEGANEGEGEGSLEGEGEGEANPTPVPRVIQKPVDEVIEILEGLGLPFLITFACDVGKPSGEVFQQSPIPGRTLSPGQVIQIGVSSGECLEEGEGE